MFGRWKVLGKEKIYIRQNKFLMLGYYKKILKISSMQNIGEKYYKKKILLKVRKV